MKRMVSLGILLAGISATAAVADDHGDTYATATMLAPNQVTINGRINTTNDYDWFGFTLTQPSRVLLYTVNPNPAVATTDTYAHLYDASGNYLGIWNNVDGAGDNFFITAQLSAGTYYLRVEEFGQDATGAYSLRMNHQDNATPIYTGSGQAAAIDPAGDHDFYKFTLYQADTINIETSGTTDTFANLYDGEGNFFGIYDNDQGAGGNFRLFLNLGAGTYYLRVIENGHDASGAYTLHVDLGAANSFPWFPFLDAANSEFTFCNNQGYYYYALAFYYYYLYHGYNIYFFYYSVPSLAWYYYYNAYAYYYWYFFYQRGDTSSGSFYYDFFSYYANASL